MIIINKSKGQVTFIMQGRNLIIKPESESGSVVPSPELLKALQRKDPAIINIRSQSPQELALFGQYPGLEKLIEKVDLSKVTEVEVNTAKPAANSEKEAELDGQEVILGFVVDSNKELTKAEIESLKETFTETPVSLGLVIPVLEKWGWGPEWYGLTLKTLSELGIEVTQVTDQDPTEEVTESGN